MTGPIVIEDVLFDAPGVNLKLLECDGTGNPREDIVLKNIVINDAGSGEAVYNVPIATVKDGYHLRLETATPLIEGAIKLEGGGSFFQPSATLVGCGLYIDDDDRDHPEVIIDLEGSTAGTQVKFEGCYTVGYGRKFCREGIFTLGEDDDPDPDVDTRWSPSRWEP